MLLLTLLPNPLPKGVKDSVLPPTLIAKSYFHMVVDCIHNFVKPTERTIYAYHDPLVGGQIFWR